MLPANPLLNATAAAGPHLPVALLRQYAAGTLAPAAQHRVEAHALACPRCADILDGLLQTPPATTDQALAQLQQRLRRRAQPTAPARPVLAVRQRRWLAPQLAAAVALLLGLVAAGWWAWQQRHLAASAPPLAATVSAPPPARPEPAISPVPTAPPPAAAPTTTAAPAARPLATARAVVKPRLRHPLPALAPPAAAPATADLAQGVPPVMQAAPPSVGAEAASAPAKATADSRADAFDATVATGNIQVPDSARFKRKMLAKGRQAAAGAEAEAALVRDKRLPGAPPVAPVPVGGLATLREKLRKGAAEFVPEDNKPLSGTVLLRLTIGADGKLGKIAVVRGLRDDYDAEAQRLLRQECPAWVPGIRDGRRVADEVGLSVSFF